MATDRFRSEPEALARLTPGRFRFYTHTRANPTKAHTMTQPMLTGPIIITRYLGPTDRLGSRVVATHRRDSSRSNCHPWRKVLSWDHALNSEANHEVAARALLDSWPHETDLQIVGRGHDADAYYWLTVSCALVEG